MKLFFSEFKANYGKYHFPYQVWLLKEEADTVEKIYDSGFLPMRNLKCVYYLSRSVRVNLSAFELSTENRRILRKTENFEANLVPLLEFEYSPQIQKMCLEYAKLKFGEKVFSSQSVKNIFQGDIYNHIFVFKEISTQRKIGFAVCFILGDIIQYAHSFYDTRFINENLGARMMLEVVDWAKRNGKKFIYLGTCYEQNALYKTEFKGVEFFNGFRWSNDLEELKELVREGQGEQGETEGQEYLLKRKEFIERFYGGDVKMILSKYGVRVNF